MKNNAKNLVQWLFLIIMLFTAYQHCDAPRNNPLDPGNPHTFVSRIRGQVLTAHTPINPISDVTVFWDIDRVFTTTNINGEFFFNNITPRNGTLSFEKTGFISESSSVNWNTSNAVYITKPLNACPRMDSLLIYTVVTKYHGDIGTPAELVIKARIYDTDNDIDTVYVKNEHLNLKKALNYNYNDRFYQETFSFTDLTSLQKAIGYNFDIYVKDTFSHTIYVGSDKAVRGIMDEILLQSPIGSLVQPKPRLEWNKYNPWYKFTWTVEIYAYNNPQVVYWKKQGIPADSTGCTVDIALPEREFFWMLWCIDEFQNRGRSKPASFTVKEIL